MLFRSQQACSVLTPRQALLAEKMTIPVKESVGKIACEAVCPCPPAIPIVMPGEALTAKSVALLAAHGFSNISVVK